MNLLLKVSTASYIDDYKIKVAFNDGLEGIVDLENEIWGEVFEPLKDKNYFKEFSQDSCTIVWDCGADFAPEFLHQLVVTQLQEEE